MMTQQNARRDGQKANQPQAMTPNTSTTTLPPVVTQATAAIDAIPAAPLDVIQAAIDAVPESGMAIWAVDFLCQATHATQYRTIFRAAAEHHGEAGIYRLLQVMTRNTKQIRHNQLCVAAASGITAARTRGKGILPVDDLTQGLSAIVMANKVVAAARAGCTLQQVQSVFQQPLVIAGD